MSRHPRSCTAGAGVAVAVLVAALVVPASAGAATTAAPSGHGSGRYVLTATDRGPTYAPTFTGNGYLGVRVPPAGQGYAPGDVPAQSEVAGFYAKPPGTGPTDVQQRGNVPTWSTLDVSDGTATFSLDSGTISSWRQSIDFHTGVITTSLTWRAPDGHRADLRFEVSTDRAQRDIGTVRLTFTPRWTGTASVTDRIDGTPATLSTGITRGTDPATAQTWESVRAQGTGVVAALATRLVTSATRASVTPLVPADPQSIGQRVSWQVRSGRTYTVTKYVGVVTSNEAADPLATARSDAAAAAATGYRGLQRENEDAWAALWAGRIDVLGDDTLATEVNASEFYLWSSIRDQLAWSVSPAGLSSNGYDGHIFWDAETWMYPSLLAQHPELARNMDDYRFQRLGAAEQHAAETGYAGARFPWESALDGTEQIPGPVSVNSEGLYEVHITADVALAQWQYWLATGDRSWLATRGWPVLSGAAAFWASRASRAADGSYHLLGVTGPDEENPDVDDEAYTNVAAATTLRIATSAAAVLGLPVPAQWEQVAAGLVVPFDATQSIHPEFTGYQGQLVKQADVTMLQYPWALPMPASVAQADLDYYVPRSDPDGPSMTDAISMIDTAALGSPGCAADVYVQRSIQPFIRDVFDQFSETRNGGAFTFMTGIGGFLQEFLYGWSGMRFGSGAVSLDPLLTSALSGVVLHDVQWQGRTFTVSIDRRTTSVTLTSGAPMPVSVRGTTSTVRIAHPLHVPTRRPDLTPTTDLTRCAVATATSAAPGAVPRAAVDGSPATDWQPTVLPAALTVRLPVPRTLRTATLTWGRQWPPAPAPNVPPPPGPVRTLRPTSYDVQTSLDGVHWTTAAHVSASTGTVDTVRLAGVLARQVRVVLDTAAAGVLPELDELTVLA